MVPKHSISEMVHKGKTCRGWEGHQCVLCLCSSKLAQDCSSQSSERHTGAKFVVAPKLVGQQRRDAFA